MRGMAGLSAVVALVVAMGGCGRGGDGPGAGPATPSASGPASNGWMYDSTWGSEVVLRARPIAADGSLGTATTLLTGPGTDTDFPGIVDGLAGLALTGTFRDFWTDELQLRDAATGAPLRTVAAPRWCGGEGAAYNLCVLLDERRLARSTELGGEGTTGGSVVVSSLDSGQDLAEYGPFPGLGGMMGTDSPDRVVLFTWDRPTGDDPEPTSGTVVELDLTDGGTRTMGRIPAQWQPLCALAGDSWLGISLGDTQSTEVVGTARVAPITLDMDESPVGCSADGRFLYVQQVPQSDGDTSASATTSVDRITLADGTRSRVLELTGDAFAGPTTR